MLDQTATPQDLSKAVVQAPAIMDPAKAPQAEASRDPFIDHYFKRIDPAQLDQLLYLFHLSGAIIVRFTHQ